MSKLRRGTGTRPPDFEKLYTTLDTYLEDIETQSDLLKEKIDQVRRVVFPDLDLMVVRRTNKYASGRYLTNLITYGERYFSHISPTAFETITCWALP